MGHECGGGNCIECLRLEANRQAKRKYADATIKCCDCGRFIGYDEITSGRAKYYFRPDSEFGHEISQWTCSKCAIPEAKGGEGQ
jgi:hypothetical protein